MTIIFPFPHLSGFCHKKNKKNMNLFVYYLFIHQLKTAWTERSILGNLESTSVVQNENRLN